RASIAPEMPRRRRRPISTGRATFRRVSLGAAGDWLYHRSARNPGAERAADTGGRMPELFVLKTYEEHLEGAWNWLVANAVSLGLSGIGQIVVVGLAFLAARRGAAGAKLLLERVATGWRYEQQLRRIAAALEPLT